MRPVVHALLLSMLASACASCALTLNAREMRRGAVGAQPDVGQCIAAGPGTVLSYSKQKSVPWLPFAYWGWRLTVAVPGELAVGHTYRIPGEAEAVLWSLAHHPAAPGRDLSGTVFIEAASGGSATARIDLQSPSSEWRLQGRERFKPVKRPLPSCSP